MGGHLAIGAAVAGTSIYVSRLVTASKHSVLFASAIGKVADKVGLSTAALQELRFAASLVNVTNKQLDMGM